MKKYLCKIIFVIVQVSLVQLLNAQGLLNLGAKIRVESTGYMYVEGRLTNDTSSLVTVYGNLTLTGELANKGHLVMESGASMLDNGITGSGITDVKRNITGGKSHYVSQPVSVATSAVFSGGFASSWDEANSQWKPLSTSELETMEGYSLYFNSDTTLAFSGSTNSGSQSLALAKIGSGWNLAGNPYPSALDWDNSAWGKSDIDNTIYLWNGTNYSYYKGTGGSNPSGAIFVNNGTRYIPAMQGFFVKSKVDNGTLSTTNAARVHANQSYYKSGDASLVRILATKKAQTDETVVYFAHELSDEVNGDEDVWKLFSTAQEVPQVYTSMVGQDLAINGIASAENHAPVNLGFTCTDSGTCKLQLTQNTVNEIQTIYLEDLKENIMINFSENPIYSFDHNPRNIKDRFRLHFNSVTKVNTIEVLNIDVFSFENKLHINSIGTSGNLNVEIYSTNGIKLYQTNVVAGSNKSISPCLPSSIYVVKVTSTEKVITKKVYL